MASLNKVMLIGHLGRDPEVRYTQSNQPVCNFSVATTENWKDQSGEKQERTTWHRITVWGRQAESCAEYLRKGRPVYIEGRIQQREYEDRDGNKKQVTEIVAERVQFLGGKSEEQERGSGYGGKSRGDEADPPPLQEMSDDSIPF